MSSGEFSLSLASDINRGKIFRRTAKYTFLDHKTNEGILEELNLETVDEKLRCYKSNWIRRVTWTNSNRMPKIILNFRWSGRRRLGRPLKRLLDEAETGLSRPDGWRVMMVVTCKWSVALGFLCISWYLFIFPQNNGFFPLEAVDLQRHSPNPKSAQFTFNSRCRVMRKIRGIEPVGLFLQCLLYGVCTSSLDRNINIRFTVSNATQRLDTCLNFICRKGIKIMWYSTHHRNPPFFRVCEIQCTNRTIVAAWRTRFRTEDDKEREREGEDFWNAGCLHELRKADNVGLISYLNTIIRKTQRERYLVS